ncbi:MAG: T9SS type A sorting domain-containing protein [Ignavibacteriales bacterium]|nr:T9SS type A sorting domain-containing protein [Ignavibacteriales bacterium]
MNHMAKALFVSLMVCGLTFAQGVRTSTYYNYPLLTGSSIDSVLNGLKSIRGVSFDDDVDGDGKSGIVVTNYADLGHVHVFKTVGNDSIQLVWSSPRVETGGGGSTPRYAVFGDLDNDGKKEVIFQVSNVGILIFEWDGVVGSGNFGTSPSQIIGMPPLAGISTFAEYLEVLDIDGDGQNELLVAYNSAPNSADRYYVIRAVGDWSTEDPGFSSFEVEFEAIRTTHANYGLGGSPYAMMSANFDGQGNKEILLQPYNFKNISPVRVPSADTYLMADTTNKKQFLSLGGTFDDVALFSGVAYDIDKDGRDEVYLPTYPAFGSPNAGKIHMISYDPGQSTSEIDSSNVAVFDMTGVIGATSLFGWGYGDIDGNGKPNLYFTGNYPYNVISLEYQGGDKKNQANWTASVLYPGEPTIYTALVIKDSSGVVDSVKTVDPSFASKIYARGTDFDKDGFEDILLPYQALSDSMTVTRLAWNQSAGAFDTTSVSRVPNPKRWGFRIIEGTVNIPTGIEAKDLTVIMPEDFVLHQNYPNPFNPSTTIRFTLPVRERISIRIFDMLGKEIRTLVNNQDQSAGTGEVVWDGRNNRGEQVASGTYFYTLFFGNFQKSQKMVLMK